MADRAGRANGRAMSADDAGVDIAQTDRVAGFGLRHDPGRANLDAFSASDAAGGVDIDLRSSILSAYCVFVRLLICIFYPFEHIFIPGQFSIDVISISSTSVQNNLVRSM